MEGSAGYDDDLQYWGASTRGNETCTTPIEKNIYLDYISCTSSLFTVEINDWSQTKSVLFALKIRTLDGLLWVVLRRIYSI